MVAGAEKLESEVVAVDPAAVVQEEAFGAEQVQEQVRGQDFISCSFSERGFGKRCCVRERVI